MSFFKRRKIRKFAEKAVEQKSTIFVFGSNIFTEAFIEQLIEIGAQEKVSLISDKKLAWIEEVRKKVNVLIEEEKEEYAKRNLYETIGFQNAEKVIILHENPIIIQNIMSFITNDELKVVLIEQFAPPFVHYLAGQKKGKIIIVDNIFQIVRELYNQMGLPLAKPPVIALPITGNFAKTPLLEIQIPGILLLNILREDSKHHIYPLDEPVQDNDKILLYLEDGDNSLRNLVDFMGNN
ncbi:MAG: hypothetical protein ACTSW1_12645 [Candidatus Hodarchaeales archaeon]